MASVFERQTPAKQATSDTEALRIAKNLLKLIGDEIESGNEFCRGLMVRAIDMRDDVRKGGSVRDNPL